MSFNLNRFRKLTSSDSIIVLFGFAAYAVFLWQSNLFDWDHFLSAFEADRRAWVNDFRVPTWSYQFCGGVTRVGDPQSFGLSPLFIFPILFGSFAGSKILVIFCSVLGFFYARSSLILIAQWLGKKSPEIDWTASLIAFNLVIGNALIWHFHHGHLTFSLYFLAFGILYYFFKVVAASLTKRDYITSNLLAAAIMTGGFFPVVVYFSFPVVLIVIVLSALAIYRTGLRAWTNKLRILALLILPGIAVAAYKWIPVLQYQSNHPRTVESSDVIEISGLFQTVIYQFLPTLYYKYLGGILQHEAHGGITHGIQEHSSFSILNWLLVILLVISLIRRKRISQFDEKKILTFKVVLLTSFVVFSLSAFGEALTVSPYVILNALLKNSVRVIGRFQFGISLTLVLCLWYLIVTRGFEKIRFVYVSCALISCLNFFSFGSVGPYHSDPLEKLTGPMRTVKLVKPPERTKSFMYRSIMAGYIVPNCYNPLVRKRRFSSKRTLEEMAKEPIFPLVDVPPDSECAKNTYVTQTDLVLDPSCPKDKINLNDFRNPIDE